MAPVTLPSAGATTGRPTCPCLAVARADGWGGPLRRYTREEVVVVGWDWLRAAVAASRRRTPAEVEAARDERRRALLMMADAWVVRGDGRRPARDV